MSCSARSTTPTTPPITTGSIARAWSTAIPTITVPILRAALVATDLSQFSNRAVPYAFAACEPDAEIHIVNVVDEDAEIDVEEVRRALLALPPLGAKQKVTAHVVRGDD